MNIARSLVLSAMIAFVFSSNAQAVESKLTIYVYPPSTTLDWSSPRALLQSFMFALSLRVSAGQTGYNIDLKDDFGDKGSVSTSYVSTMGHTIGHIKCALPNGKTYDKWASFSGQDYIELDDRVMNQMQLGLGALYYGFLDGHIIAGEENWRRLVHYQNLFWATPRFMEFSIDSAACERTADMIKFFEGFHFKPGTPLKDLEKRTPEQTLYFSAIHDPYETYVRRMQTGHGEVGGGCAPFGASLLKMAGVYPSFFDRYIKRTFKISERLIGGIIDEKTGDIRRVTVAQILAHILGTAWEHEDFKSRDFGIYDPQLIYDFIGTLQKCADREECPSDVSQWLEENRLNIKRDKHEYKSRWWMNVQNPKGPGSRKVQKTVTGKFSGVKIVDINSR